MVMKSVFRGIFVLLIMVVMGLSAQAEEAKEKGLVVKFYRDSDKPVEIYDYSALDPVSFSMKITNNEDKPLTVVFPPFIFSYGMRDMVQQSLELSQKRGLEPVKDELQTMVFVKYTLPVSRASAFSGNIAFSYHKIEPGKTKEIKFTIPQGRIWVSGKYLMQIILEGDNGIYTSNRVEFEGVTAPATQPAK